MAQARFIYHVIVVDLMIDPATNKLEQTETGADKQPDVVAEITLCGSSPAEAADKAFKAFIGENLVQQGRRYHVQCMMMAPLPQTGHGIIVPNAGESKAILRAGEITAPPNRPGIAA